MLELVGYEFRLNGERVGLFTGTPSQRMQVEDRLREDTFSEEQVAAIIDDINDQVKPLNDIVSDLEVGETDDLEVASRIHGVIEELKEIDVK